MAHTASDLVSRALARLAESPGFVERENQRQLSLLISDCIEGSQAGVFEAPTGLGKSLAALIPAIANAIAGERRTVISTYTNVLAEQYWRKDLPLALSLFESEECPKTAFLIGKQRYSCVAEINAHAPEFKTSYLPKAKIGIESEFRDVTGLKGREAVAQWRRVHVPAVCPARLCDFYSSCLYYRSRREAAKASVVITNHSVVLMDALQGEDHPLLGDYDMLVVDEAHDFHQAALSAFEFTLDEGTLSQAAAIATGMERVLRERAQSRGVLREFANACGAFRKATDAAKFELSSVAVHAPRSCILAAAPKEIADFPTVGGRIAGDVAQRVFPIGRSLFEACKAMDKAARDVLRKDGEDDAEDLRDTALSYRQYLAEFGLNCKALESPEDGAVCYLEALQNGVAVKKAATEVSALLQEKIWSRRPSVCMSATLAIDGDFEFFEGLTGVKPQFREVLESPFDFSSQASVYLPPEDAVPDPVAVRKENAHELYYAALARELEKVITALGGRTLALFHSRAEMEGVLERITLPEDLPVYAQRRSAAGSVGEAFRKNVRASLFALRSFWTGFDAPGETLSCVALTRIPFEVPVDPPSLVRSASMTLQGRDPFREHALAMAKMLMRQGAGRLIRNTEDRGIIAILDPRVRTKNYGEAILENLPRGMRTFRDIHEAMAAIGLE